MTSRFVPLLCLAIACGPTPVTTAPTGNPAPNLHQRRVEILHRDVAWAMDTIMLMRFAPFDGYAVVRVQIERCSGLTRAGWPTFYVAPISPLPGHVLGFYDEKRQAIVFALGNEIRAATVGHELLHWLLAPHIPSARGEYETYHEYQSRVHPDSVFGTSGKCGAVLYPPTN